jgi:Ca2+-binding RTX toxin-like protein
MSRFKMFGVMCVLLAVGGLVERAGATDCDDIADYYEVQSLSCGGVCSYDAGPPALVTCTGATGSANNFILFVDGSNPIIHGNSGATQFCCESSDLGSITSAVKVDITGGSSTDVICLTDSSVLSCTDAVNGTQWWEADSIIDAGQGLNTVVTSPEGTCADDVTTGNGVDTIKTYDGDDVVYSNDAADAIDVGAGNDYVDAGRGDDTVYGGDGDDELLGGLDGDDTIYGEGGDDLIDGGNETDTLYGGGGVDTLIGGEGTDTLVGGGSYDCLCGGRLGVDINDDGVGDSLDGGLPSVGDACYYVTSEGDSGTNCGDIDESANDDCDCDWP